MMRGVIEGWRRLRSIVRRDALEAGLDEEIRFHLDRQTEKHLRAGMPPGEARRRALVKFGGVDGLKEATRDQFRAAVVEDTLRDLRYGARALWRAPAFTIVVVLTLALGIGATTAMFSVVYGILLRPLPYPDQDRLIELVHEAPGLGIRQLFASPAIYFGYRDHNRTFESVGLWDWDSSPVTVTGSGEPESIQSLEVTHEVLALLGAHPIMGRTFSEADDRPGSPATALISHGYWRRRFAGVDPIEQTLVVDGVARHVIGVLPPSFRFFHYPADIFYPLQPVRSAAAFPSFDGRGIARVRKAVTLAQANADAARMIPLLIDEFNREPAQTRAVLAKAQFTPQLRWLKDTVVGDLRDTLWLLMGTIGVLLLIACANVSNLVLARTETRRPELAIRAALGAGRAALARVVFAESTILGLAGGAAGLAAAYGSLPLLLALGAADLPGVMTVTIDRPVLIVTMGVSLLATVVVALVPLFHLAASQRQLARAMHGGRGVLTGGREGTRARHTLVVSQVALALVLLIGSGLMLRTFHTLRRVDPGFADPDAVQTFQITIPAPAGEQRAAGSSEGALRANQAILERLAAVPGVTSAGFAAFNDGLPLDGDGRSSGIVVEGRAQTDRMSALKEMQFVSPRFFEALRTPLVAGRTFDWNDVYQQHRVVIVAENLARAEWGSAAAALGKRIATRASGPWWEVVGVVQDVHHNGLNQPAPETVVFPAVASATTSFVVRNARVGQEGFLNDLRRAVWSVNANLSLANVRTLGELYRRSLARTTMTLQLLGITAAMALLLGLIGIYGVVSYAVSQRRREIGIRVALGARRGQVRRMFVSRALVLVGIGVVLGLGSAAALTRLMQSQLFGVSPLDPLTHTAVAVGLVCAAALASYISARRASALDPVQVLKGE